MKGPFLPISLVAQGFNFVLQETFDSGWVHFSLERGGHYHCHLVGRSQKESAPLPIVHRSEPTAKKDLV